MLFIGDVAGQGVPRDPQHILVFLMGFLQGDHRHIVFVGYLFKDVDLGSGETFDIELELSFGFKFTTEEFLSLFAFPLNE